MTQPIRDLMAMGLTLDEAEQMLMLLSRWRRYYQQGLSALLLRNAVNRAGQLVSAKDSKFDTPAFAFEMGKARAMAEVATMIDDLADTIIPDGGDYA